LLVDAENPVLIADRYARSPDGAKRLVELAEVLQCPIYLPKEEELGPGDGGRVALVGAQAPPIPKHPGPDVLSDALVAEHNRILR